MNLMNRVFRVMSTAILISIGVVSPSVCQPPVELNVLSAPVNTGTAVRFFFTPGNYFHAPIIFRVVAPKDSRLNTAPMLQEGRTVYISAPEMQRLLKELQKLGLSWRESNKAIEFGDATKILPDYRLAITVLSSSGTAEGGFDPAMICTNLAPLDSSFSTPRALWEFQLFREEYKCKVPGLDGNAYPDHWPWNTGSGNSAGSHPKQQ
jgi:hypothetical protein